MKQDRSHAPLVIRKNVDETMPELIVLHNPFDTCCDRIEIVYEDFSLRQMKISFNHLKFIKFHIMQNQMMQIMTLDTEFIKK